MSAAGGAALHPSAVSLVPSPSQTATHSNMIPVWKIKIEFEKVLKKFGLSSENIDSAKYKSSPRNIFLKLLKTVVEDSKSRSLLASVGPQCRSKQWFVPKLTRKESERYLDKQTVGAFVVRMTRTKDRFALTLKYGADQFHHYEISILPGEKFCLLGCDKTFSSLSSLVLHFCILREIMPVTLCRNLIF